MDKETISVNRQQLFAALPDLPRWVETRGMIVDPAYRIVTGERWQDGFIVVDREPEGLASIVGPASAELIESATREAEEVLVFEENLESARRALADWFVEQVAVHRLAPGVELPPPDHPGRRLNPGEVGRMRHLPAQLAHELADAEASGAQIIAVHADDLAVAFCYPSFTSETMWDTSIDTLEPYRRRGLARSAFLHLAHLMRKEHRLEPVWCSAQSNPVSALLARSIGFEQVDSFWIATRYDPAGEFPAPTPRHRGPLDVP